MNTTKAETVTGEGNAPRVNTDNQNVRTLSDLPAPEAFWTDVKSNKAWRLAQVEGKAAPYCGYMIKLQSGDLRCIRTDNVTRYQFRPTQEAR